MSSFNIVNAMVPNHYDENGIHITANLITSRRILTYVAKIRLTGVSAAIVRKWINS